MRVMEARRHVSIMKRTLGFPSNRAGLGVFTGAGLGTIRTGHRGWSLLLLQGRARIAIEGWS